MNPRRVCPLLVAGVFILVLTTSLVWAGGREDLESGFVCLRFAEFENALRHLEAAIASGELNRSELISAYTLRGDAHASLHNLNKALASYEQALKLTDSRDRRARAKLYLKRGKVWIKKGEYQRAIADLNRALALDPNKPMAYYYRGTAWRLQRRFRKAVEDYTRAISLKKNPAFYYHRSQAYTRMGMVDKAVADMEKAVRLSPHRRQYRTRLEYLKSLRDR
jgi:tetratricopeptide (TPR) repeat protein